MKTTQTIGLALLLVCLGVPSPLPGGGRAGAQARRVPADTWQETVRQKRRENFKSGRDLLVRRNVPFDPDLLLEDGWQTDLAATFDAMPEMRTPKWAGRKIRGAQLAGDLYLPEKVELTGHTVILARRLIFEGRDVVIKGNYDVHIFPVEEIGLLGGTLESALKKSELRFVRAGLAGAGAANYSRPALPFIRGGSVTVDTHGAGRKEWLERQREQQQQGGRGASLLEFSKAGYAGRAPSPQTTIDRHGAGGADGISATGVGSHGAHGATATSATVGTCSGNRNGGTGGAGNSGNVGGLGPNGGNASPGNPGGSISLVIPNGSTSTYSLISYGGDGGRGGDGGTGGTGGTGSDGAPGGPGASCLCSAGGN
ncbi:MAG TPA: hypothetical protein VN228_15180, partial [Pyrinomonadaceae bacterium]|nr:hypothetical protein [Pyrinomonadaceae bacterium]